MRLTIALPLLAAPGLALAGVSGTAYGFAASVTGGGSATTVYPSDTTQLASYLADSTPRVIMITKTFDFRGTSVTGSGCRPTATCAGGQETIKDSCDSNEVAVTVVYDAAGVEGLTVASHKSLVGVGSSGALVGKGLRLVGGSNNIIIQNIRISDINPKFVWGGDAISLEGNDGVWIDHCTFANVGRMFLVSHYTGTRATISWNLFDGATSYSSSCNGQQYWGTMFLGEADKISLDKNYYLEMSGRSPKVGGESDSKVLFHATNNLWDYGEGHAFDVAEGAYALLEGNRILSTTTPITSDSQTAGGYVYDVPDSSYTSACSSYLGRSCVINAVTDSGTWYSIVDTEVLSALSSYKTSLVAPVAVSDVLGNVRDNSGVGHL